MAATPDVPLASGATPGPTLGVEEELHVADAATGRLCSRGAEVIASARARPDDGTVVAELTLSQVETVTGVGTDVQDVLARASGLRRAAAVAAAGHGLDLLATGTPVLGDAAEQSVADDARYERLRTRAASLVAQQLIAGMHVHVGVAPAGTRVEDVDDDARVAVVDALRPWLPVLLALSANSPYWLGTDTGFSSYRHVHWQRWPVVGPPPATRDAAGWRAAVSSVVDAGVVDDASYVYWDVRLAPRYPTVEVRVADVVPTTQDAALFVALVRGLAARTLDEHGAAGEQPDVPQHALRAAMWRAARHGMDEQLVDPRTATLAPALQVLRALVDQARPGLERCGDLELVTEHLERLVRDGNGAQRQRAAYARAGWSGVLDVVRVRAGEPPAPAGDADVASVGEAATIGEIATAVATLGDGNGWVDCRCGQRHWGRYGAAGLLVVRPGDREPEVLLQLRASWTHHGGTWGLPGGARDSHETVSQAARREAQEEAAVDPAALTDVGCHIVDHGTWSYTYVLATAPPQTPAAVANRESDAVDWVPLSEVVARDLHPGFATAWPLLRQQVRALAG